MDFQAIVARPTFPFPAFPARFPFYQPCARHAIFREAMLVYQTKPLFLIVYSLSFVYTMKDMYQVKITTGLTINYCLTTACHKSYCQQLAYQESKQITTLHCKVARAYVSGFTAAKQPSTKRKIMQGSISGPLFHAHRSSATNYILRSLAVGCKKLSCLQDISFYRAQKKSCRQYQPNKKTLFVRRDQELHKFHCRGRTVICLCADIRHLFSPHQLCCQLE